jgi:hypothetical protein
LYYFLMVRWFIEATFGRLVLTFCINSTRGRGGHESPRWIRALGKGDGRTDRTFASHPQEPLSSHGDITDPWRGPAAVLNGRTDDISILRPPYLCRWLCRTRSLHYWSHADSSPNPSGGGHALTSFWDHTSGLWAAFIRKSRRLIRQGLRGVECTPLPSTFEYL